MYNNVNDYRCAPFDIFVDGKLTCLVILSLKTMLRAVKRLVYLVILL